MKFAGAAVDAGRADDAAVGIAQQTGDEQPVDQLHAFGFEGAAQLPAEFQPAAVRMHDAGEIEPAGRTARIAAVIVAGEGHAHRFEVAHAGVGIGKRLAHQYLVGDAVIAGDDFAQDSVDIVVRENDDLPGVGKGGVAGSADHPGIDQGHPRAGRAVAFGAERGEQPAGAGADDQDVGIGQQTVELCHERSPRPRPVFHRRMHIDDALGAEDFAAETGDAVLAELDHRQQIGRAQAGNSGGLSTGSIWMTSAGQTMSQMPQPVHLEISMRSIMWRSFPAARPFDASLFF